MDRIGRKFLFLDVPWRTPNTPNLGAATLRAILTQERIASDLFHGSLCFPRVHDDSDFMEISAAHLFVPYLYPQMSLETYLADLKELHENDTASEGIVYFEETFARVTIDFDKLRPRVEADIERAGVCLARIVERASRPEYDIVGLCLTFESQIPAALAIANRLREKNPAVHIVFGGSACADRLGEALLAAFPVIDVVCCSEGETVIVPLVRALRGEGSLADVPGLAYREGGALRRTESPPLVRDMDSLPIPDYADFLAQMAESEWSDVAPEIYFETSRGCWYGQKKACTFCGYNQEQLSYRKKSPERAYQEILTLYRSYPTAAYLHAMDNILDRDYLRSLLPRLEAFERDPGHPLKLLYWVRCDLDPAQLRSLVAAGVVAVQAGVESFHDEILKLMYKGAKAVKMVQFIKWATEVGLQVAYNLLVRNPNEQAAWYHDMAELIPFINHLPPPGSTRVMVLQRYSRYSTALDEHGITDVRPKQFYAKIFRDPGMDFESLAYSFDFDHPSFHDPDLLFAQRRFMQALVEWNTGWKNHEVYCLAEDGRVLVVDTRSGTGGPTLLSGVAAQLFRYLDRYRSMELIRSEFSWIAPEVLQCLLDTWVHRRWVYRDPAGVYLAVVPQRGRQPEASLDVQDETLDGHVRLSRKTRNLLGLQHGQHDRLHGQDVVSPRQ